MKQICLNSIFFLLFFFGGMVLHAQETTGGVLSKNQIKLKKLEGDVQRAEVKVKTARAKLEYSDSLIRVGEEMESEAIANIISLENEANIFTKQQNSEYKLLNKQRKGASEEELIATSKEIKDLDLRYKSEIKDIEKKIKIEYKKLEKGISNKKKGKEKQKQYQSTLEDYLDLLHDAEKKLEEFKLEIE